MEDGMEGFCMKWSGRFQISDKKSSSDS